MYTPIFQFYLSYISTWWPCICKAVCTALYNVSLTTDQYKDYFKGLNSRERGRFFYYHLSRRLTKLEYRVLIYYLKGYNYQEIVNILRGENLLDSYDDDIDKKAVDNGLSRIKKKATDLKEEIDNKNKLQDEMFMNLSERMDKKL